MQNNRREGKLNNHTSDNNRIIVTSSSELPVLSSHRKNIVSSQLWFNTKMS